MANTHKVVSLYIDAKLLARASSKPINMSGSVAKFIDVCTIDDLGDVKYNESVGHAITTLSLPNKTQARVKRLAADYGMSMSNFLCGVYRWVLEHPTLHVGYNQERERVAFTLRGKHDMVLTALAKKFGGYRGGIEYLLRVHRDALRPVRDGSIPKGYFSGLTTVRRTVLLDKDTYAALAKYGSVPLVVRQLVVLEVGDGNSV